MELFIKSLNKNNEGVTFLFCFFSLFYIYVLLAASSILIRSFIYDKVIYHNKLSMKQSLLFSYCQFDQVYISCLIND